MNVFLNEDWCVKLFHKSFTQIVKETTTEMLTNGTDSELESFTTVIPINGFTAEAKISIRKSGFKKRIYIAGEVDGEPVRSKGRNHSFFTTIMTDALFNEKIARFCKLWLKRTDYQNIVNRFGGFIERDWIYRILINHIIYYSDKINIESSHEDIMPYFNTKQLVLNKIERELDERKCKL